MMENLNCQNGFHFVYDDILNKSVQDRIGSMIAFTDELNDNVLARNKLFFSSSAIEIHS